MFIKIRENRYRKNIIDRAYKNNELNFEQKIACEELVGSYYRNNKDKRKIVQDFYYMGNLLMLISPSTKLALKSSKPFKLFLDDFKFAKSLEEFCIYKGLFSERVFS